MIRALALIVCRINLIYMCLDNNNKKNKPRQSGWFKNCTLTHQPPERKCLAAAWASCAQLGVSDQPSGPAGTGLAIAWLGINLVVAHMGKVLVQLPGYILLVVCKMNRSQGTRAFSVQRGSQPNLHGSTRAAENSQRAEENLRPMHATSTSPRL